MRELYREENKEINEDEIDDLYKKYIKFDKTRSKSKNKSKSKGKGITNSKNTLYNTGQKVIRKTTNMRNNKYQ